MQARAAAARVVDAVIRQGESLDVALARWLERVPPADRGLLQELSYGTLRWQPRLAALAGRLLHRPLRERDGDVSALLLVGLYQLSYTRVPAHAAVAETVAAATLLRKRWAASLLNAGLRRWQREGEALGAALAGDAQA
ncbi:MAG TPA: transcription antitermination factor NusB, partial [Gammaproteobacteria bacterium]